MADDLDKLRPIAFVYEGDGVLRAPTSFWCGQCKEHFVVGERYFMSNERERSFVSHRHYFADLNEAWLNLPENIAEQFPTPGALRAHALLETGQYTERQFVVETPAEAHRFAAFLEDGKAEWTAISVSGCAVVERRPISQNYKEMGHDVFQASKNKVLNLAWAIAGVDREEWEGEAT